MSDFEMEYVDAENDCLHAIFWHNLHKEYPDGSIEDIFECKKCGRKTMKFYSSEWIVRRMYDFISNFKEGGQIEEGIHLSQEEIDELIEVASAWLEKASEVK